jgi:thioredoxin-related protein/YHS domain-containing protein
MPLAGHTRVRFSRIGVWLVCRRERSVALVSDGLLEDDIMTMARIACLTIALLGLAITPASAEVPGWHTDFEIARRTAQQQNQPMLLHFYADWCFPCKRMEKDVLSRPAVVQVLSAHLVLVKVNVDQFPDLAKRFGINQFPSDVIVDPTGERILTSTGFQEADKYVAFARLGQRQYSDQIAATLTSTTIEGAESEATQQKPAAAEAPSPMIALDGYCPVTLSATREWVKGDSAITSEHRGQVYYLKTADQKAAFDVEPRKFVPQLLGCDPVILRDTDLAVPGSIRFGAYYDDELFLFTSQENRTAFKAEPERYTRTRVVRSADEIDRSVLR